MKVEEDIRFNEALWEAISGFRAINRSTGIRDKMAGIVVNWDYYSPCHYSSAPKNPTPKNCAVSIVMPRFCKYG
jgi:hypothetical protein